MIQVQSTNSAAEFRRMIAQVERIAEQEVEDVVTFVYAEIQTKTPKDTRFAASTLRINVGAPFPGFPKTRTDRAMVSLPMPREVAQTALAGFTVGQTVIINALASYFNILAGGRRPDKNGRMIGSTQANAPFLSPAIDAGLRMAKLTGAVRSVT